MEATMKQTLEQFILAAYPDAELSTYMDSQYGIEYTFYPTHEANETYTCFVDKNGILKILTDF